MTYPPPPKEKISVLQSLESLNMLHGKKDFANIIRVKNLKIGRLSWILWVGPV